MPRAGGTRVRPGMCTADGGQGRLPGGGDPKSGHNMKQQGFSRSTEGGKRIPCRGTSTCEV